MNRRDYLRSLAVGSIGLSVSPFDVHINNPAEGDMSAVTPDVPSGPIAPSGNGNTTFMVADRGLIAVLAPLLPASMVTIPIDAVDADRLVQSLANGDALVWLGDPDHVPKALSVGAHALADEPLDMAWKGDCPLVLKDVPLKPARAMGAYIAPPKGMPYHNVDEEIRADFLPVLEAKDRFGEVIGYPAVYMNYFAPSLALGRFEGCECFFFFVTDPLQLMDAAAWQSVLQGIDQKRSSFLQVTDFNTNYSAFHHRERVQLRVRLRNRNDRAVSAMLRFSVKYSGTDAFRPLGALRRVPEGKSATEAIFDFIPEFRLGLCEIKLEVLQDVEKAELLAVDGDLKVVETRHLAFLLANDVLKTPVNHAVKGPNLEIDGEGAFWVGTHYYPSSSWWEWVWRDYRPLKAEEDFAAIRKAGYRIARVWINPVIDEQVLRSIDVAIDQAARHGIVVILTLFTQWVRQMGFQRDSGEQVLFDFRHPRDFNLISVSLRNIDLQREFISILAKRWKHAGNLIFNLSNEVYIKDPDASQMDREVQAWPEVAMPAGTLRDSLLYKRWAKAMTAVLRENGAQQSVLPGYLFSTLDGGDVLVANEDAPMVPWHNYYPAEHAGLKLQYFDPIAANKPVLLEEFGYGEWNPTERYDGTVHYALAAGATGAVSYEWGLSWLARESCYWPLPLRETLVDDPDPRWFSPFAEMAKLMSERGVGMCPTPSGTGYGSIYHGTPFPASAAIALGRLGLFGKGLQRTKYDENTYVVVPKARLEAIEILDETFRKLWAGHVLFGVWQEEQLMDLPKSAKVVICPMALGKAATAQLDRLKNNGVSVYKGDGWQGNAVINRVGIDADNVRLLARRTANGLLLTAASEKPLNQVTLRYKGNAVGFGLGDFGMAHLTDRGIPQIEGAGTITVANELVCRVANGRIMMATDAVDLRVAGEIRLMVTTPTEVTFARTITQVRITDGLGNLRQISNSFAGKTLLIDDQLVRYIIVVCFHNPDQVH
ncbi:hypothetical protein GCM10007415_24680 [Parapedobacter pyrenivorans]|uniref:Glycoside hydrolase family 5 domain-containing protein n=1 Tax=Parapedobacter pyrenivorans TaxID=1305674 RepID=A0A917HTJ6_9SPHI|nr:cellulase family glycosylhydrolase [Parapedobacter pyrenivorans]GGG89550.1 hypothetical protein GCM10007415_24680 [Parapedobacter pyrenivorans]